jgi:hypothetical protein
MSFFIDAERGVVALVVSRGRESFYSHVEAYHSYSWNSKANGRQ